MSFGELKLPKSRRNVVVRCLERKDLDELYTIESDPEVKRFLGGPVLTSREEWIRGMESNLAQCGTLAVLAKQDLQFAGRAAIKFYSLRAGLEAREIEVVISKDYWGNHFGPEVCETLIASAFDELATERIVGVVHPENEKSLKLLHLFGFEKAGIISDLTWQHGYLKFVLPHSRYQKCTPPS